MEKTIKWIQEHSPMEIFERVEKHLLGQGERASDGEGCFYKTKDGLRCAVGCLIEDDEYNPFIEGGPFDSFLPPLEIGKKKRNLLFDMQNIHDNEDKAVSSWPKELNIIKDKIRAGEYDKDTQNQKDLWVT